MFRSYKGKLWIVEAANPDTQMYTLICYDPRMRNGKEQMEWQWTMAAYKNCQSVHPDNAAMWLFNRRTWYAEIMTKIREILKSSESEHE